MRKMVQKVDSKNIRWVTALVVTPKVLGSQRSDAPPSEGGQDKVGQSCETSYSLCQKVITG